MKNKKCMMVLLLALASIWSGIPAILHSEDIITTETLSLWEEGAAAPS